jgi:DNA-directed RNA polymerase specialized sigma24 family protein
MDRYESWTEILARLRPLLEQLFDAYEISPGQAKEIVEEVCLVLISKRPRRQDPEGWLLRTVQERCEEIRKRRFEIGD